MPAGRIAALGATADFHHGLLGTDRVDRGPEAATPIASGLQRPARGFRENRRRVVRFVPFWATTIPTMRSPRRAIATLLVLAAWAAPAVAQQTRREALERRREEKARQIRKYKAGALEAALLYIEDKQILERFGPDIDGFYPRIGGLTTGSGFAGGVGYRKHFGDHAIVRASTALSI